MTFRDLTQGVVSLYRPQSHRTIWTEAVPQTESNWHPTWNGVLLTEGNAEVKDEPPSEHLKIESQPYFRSFQIAIAASEVSKADMSLTPVIGLIGIVCVLLRPLQESTQLLLSVCEGAKIEVEISRMIAGR